MLFYGKNKCRIVDMGPEPLVASVEELAEWNGAFRAALWTGENLQSLVMDIPKGRESGEAFTSLGEQFYFCVAGCGTVVIADGAHRIRFQKRIHQGFGIWIPSDCWFNLINDGKKALKLLAVLAPPREPHGTYEGNL